MPIEECRFTADIGQSVAKPYLNVIYINPHTGKSLKAKALIDTGADFCILPAEYAELLGHELDQGESSEVIGVSGDAVSMYKHTMQIQINGFKTKEILISFNPHFNKPLLGVGTFVAHFILTVNYPAQTFSLKLPNAEEDFSSWSKP